MSGEFEAVFRSMVDRIPDGSPARARRPTKTLEQRLAYLSEWRTTRECAMAWKISHRTALAYLVR